VPVFTVLVSVLMVMAPGLRAMVVSMCMFVLMFVAVSLSRFVHVFMAMAMFMRMRAFHEWRSFQKNLLSYYHSFSSHGIRAVHGLSDTSPKRWESVLLRQFSSRNEHS
jgi:hypothetical protein